MNSNIIDLVSNRGPATQLAQAKWAYSTRRIAREDNFTLVRGAVSPRVGDVMLAEVTRIGQHKRLELTSGRRAYLFKGDLIVVTYANRYAPDQYEAIVPNGLTPCDLVAAGGIASKLTFKHESMKTPTAIEPVGLLADEKGRIINLARYALPRREVTEPRSPVIAVIGTSMNAGKTTTAANLIRGLTEIGYAVGAGKVTGTGSGGDVWFMQDAGARQVLDFIDAGYPSTYLLSLDAVKQTFTTLLAHLNQGDTDIIVLEISDGLHQAETAGLVSSELFIQYVDAVIFAAGDALGAVYGVGLLEDWGLPVAAVSGLVTRSPLAMREIQDALDLPILNKHVLHSEVIEDYLKEWLNPTVRAKLHGGEVR